MIKIVENESEFFVLHLLKMRHYGQQDVYSYEWKPVDVVEGFADAVKRAEENWYAYRITELKTGKVRAEYISEENIKPTVEPPKKSEV